MRFPRELNDHETGPFEAPFPFHLLHPMNGPMNEDYNLMEVVTVTIRSDEKSFI